MQTMICRLFGMTYLIQVDEVENVFRQMVPILLALKMLNYLQ